MVLLLRNRNPYGLRPPWAASLRPQVVRTLQRHVPSRSRGAKFCARMVLGSPTLTEAIQYSPASLANCPTFPLRHRFDRGHVSHSGYRSLLVYAHDSVLAQWKLVLRNTVRVAGYNELPKKTTGEKVIIMMSGSGPSFYGEDHQSRDRGCRLCDCGQQARVRICWTRIPSHQHGSQPCLMFWAEPYIRKDVVLRNGHPPQEGQVKELELVVLHTVFHIGTSFYPICRGSIPHQTKTVRLPATEPGFTILAE